MARNNRSKTPRGQMQQGGYIRGQQQGSQLNPRGQMQQGSRIRGQQQGGQLNTRGQMQQGRQSRGQQRQDSPQMQQDSGRSTLSQFTDTVREHPKTAIAAGAAVAAGVAAAVYGTRGWGSISD